jgi:hypothetical protein
MGSTTLSARTHRHRIVRLAPLVSIDLIIRDGMGTTGVTDQNGPSLLSVWNGAMMISDAKAECWSWGRCANG